MIRIIDRYILRQFLATFIFSLVALCLLFVIVGLIEKLDNFLDRKVPIQAIALYYVYYVPNFIKLSAPIALLLTNLFTFGKMANLNELSAIKAGGVSLYRLLMPVIFLCGVLSIGQLYFNGWVVPKANAGLAEIDRKYLGGGGTSTSVYNLFIRDAALRNVMINFYDDISKTGSRISIEEYSSFAQPRILKRIDAEKFLWDSAQGQWKLSKGFTHTFLPDSLVMKPLPQEISSQAFDTISLRLSTTPAQLMELQKNTSEMTFTELKNYIELSARGGKDVRKSLVEYFGEFALPFANVIVVLFGMPFSSGKRKGGLALEITIAIIVSFLYLACTRIGQVLGIAADFDPMISAWLANIVFAFVGIGMIFRIRT